MRFDCIIPSYNNCDELRQCLQGLEGQRHKDFRAIVCVDGSTDETVAWLSDYRPSFELLVCEHADRLNHGRNATRNLALPHLQAPYLCFLDSDLVPHASLLEEHASLLSRRDCISVGDVRYHSADTNVWADYAQTRGKNKYKHGDEIPYYYLATGNCAHRSTLFSELDGQDPLITLYGGGDTEYALRLHQRFHLPVLFNARSVAYGEMQKSLAEALNQLEQFGKLNLRYIHRKHPQEYDVFWLGRFEDRSLGAAIFRSLLQPRVSAVVQTLVPLIPSSLRRILINYCVLTRIYKGWVAAKKEEGVSAKH